MDVMTIGTTRQLLRDRQWRRDHPSPVTILRGDDGTLQATIAPREELRVAAVKTMRYVGGALAGLALLCALIALAGAPGFWMAAFVVAWLCLCQMIFTLLAYDSARRSVVIRIDHDLIAVDSSGPFGARHWQMPRAQLKDVRLISRQPKWERKGATFRPLWIVFDSKRFTLDRRYFEFELTADDYIAVADAIRESLGMPRRSWS